jgi:hypothetical protein
LRFAVSVGKEIPNRRSRYSGPVIQAATVKRKTTPQSPEKEILEQIEGAEQDAKDFFWLFLICHLPPRWSFDLYYWWLDLKGEHDTVAKPIKPMLASAALTASKAAARIPDEWASDFA